MSILKKIEHLATFTSTNFCFLAIINGLIIIMFIVTDAYYGLTGSLGEKAQKGLANLCGKAGFMLALIALVYYLLHEIYVWIKKQGILLSTSFEIALKSIVSITRSIHPCAGFLAIYSVIVHGYIFVFWKASNKGILAIGSGVFALLALVLLGVGGWLLRLNRHSSSLKKHHKYIAFLFFSLYFIHKASAD
jgi:heme/copper-type cytochrome/quinol oxidase subunit 4